jgi:hypothetical protein
MKKIHDLDQSPHAYRVEHGVLFDTAKKAIEKLSTQYNYKGSLLKLVIELPSWVNSYKDVQRQRSRLKTQKTLYLKTMKAAKKLQDYMKYFSGDMRGKMRDDRRKENRFAAFSAVENNLPFLIDKCHINALSTPKDKGGQQTGSLPKDLIWLSMQQYEFNVGREATCGWDEIKGKHVGDFYHFMIELKPFIKEMGIDLGEDRSIGQYTRELLISRNKTRKKLTALIIIIISNPEFFAKNCPDITCFFLISSLDKLYFLRSPHFAFTQD